MKNKKRQLQFLHFSFENFTLVNFQKEITNNFNLNSTYSLLLKISSSNNLIFKMCGPQIGLIIENEHNYDYYAHLYRTILTRIETTIDSYTYIEEVEGIEIIYSILNPLPELKLKNINNYNLNKQVLSINKAKKEFNQNLLPLTTDSSYYGKLILEKEKYIKLLNINNLKQKITILDEDKMFLYRPYKKETLSRESYIDPLENSQYNLDQDSNSPTTIQLKIKDMRLKSKQTSYIVLCKKIDEFNSIKYLFDSTTGILINSILDNIENKNINVFSRTIGNLTLIIKNQIVIYYKVKYELKPIKKENKSIRDRNLYFGSFDLETFKDTDNIAKVYALGYFTSIDQEPKLYYLTDLSE